MNNKTTSVTTTKTFITMLWKIESITVFHVFIVSVFRCKFNKRSDSSYVTPELKLQYCRVNAKVVWVLEGVRVTNARQPVKTKGTLQVLVRDTKQTNIKKID